MEQFLGNMLGCLIVAVIVITAQQIEARRSYKRWKATLDAYPLKPSLTFTFKGLEPSIEEVFRTSDRIGREIGDLYHVGTADHYTIHVWDGKAFAMMGTSEPLKEETK